MRHPMDTIARPSSEDLRRAQAALNALNQAYDYFAALPTTAEKVGAAYLPYSRAA